MLDILILYSLHKQEQTFYGLAKMIAEHFGEVSIPSHGALHPALKKLTDEGLLSIRKKMSDGGKRYTYYTVSDNFKDSFNEKFLQFNYSKTQTVDAFLLDLKAHIYTYELLDKNFAPEFKEKALLKLSSFEGKLNQKLGNSYLELNELQKKVLELYLIEISEYKKLVEKLN